jgi:3-hydroxybutyryl-CoA dehydrogenase
MPVTTINAGTSRSFPSGASGVEAGDGMVIIGSEAGVRYAEIENAAEKAFVAIELGTECLANHVGLDALPAHVRTVGFARFRMGDADPSPLVELVRMPWTEAGAVAAAKAAFEQAGLVVAICEDFPGRIVDRLIRPYLNAVLRRYDEGLASAADFDMTLRLGLGYPEGPLALLDRTGLAQHYDVTSSLYRQLGDEAYAPARRAQIAKARATGNAG